MAGDKRYTVDEANALLPYLAPTLVELRDRSEEAARIKEQMEVASASNGGSTQRERWARTLARVQELAERLEEWEIVLRDLDSGLVDFPAVVEGQEAYLCWRLGEPEIAHWHSPDDGFRGRRRL
ncbi:MAG TPA: DUF2203 domain-containing protein [Actinomycetota bacterium]|nr:DUF2203 domain-containing protein [Actinomycetota bacterium]